VFGNRVLRNIFVPKGADVTGDWNNLRYEDNYYRHSSANIIRLIDSRTMRWAELVSPVGERRGLCMILVGKPAEKRPLGRPRHRWEDNITLGSQRNRSERSGLDSSSSGLGQVAGCCECGNEPSDFMKCGGDFLTG